MPTVVTQLDRFQAVFRRNAETGKSELVSWQAWALHYLLNDDGSVMKEAFGEAMGPAECVQAGFPLKLILDQIHVDSITQREAALAAQQAAELERDAHKAVAEKARVDAEAAAKLAAEVQAELDAAAEKLAKVTEEAKAAIAARDAEIAALQQQTEGEAT